MPNEDPPRGRTRTRGRPSVRQRLNPDDAAPAAAPASAPAPASVHHIGILGPVPVVDFGHTDKPTFETLRRAASALGICIADTVLHETGRTTMCSLVTIFSIHLSPPPPPCRIAILRS